VTGAEAWRAVWVVGTATPCSGDEVLAGAASPPVSGMAQAAGITVEVAGTALTARTAGTAEGADLAGTATEGCFIAGASPPDTLIVTGTASVARAAAGAAVTLAGGTAADPGAEGFSPSQSFCDSKSVVVVQGFSADIRATMNMRIELLSTSSSQLCSFNGKNKGNTPSSLLHLQIHQRSQRTCKREHLRPAGAGGLYFILGFSLLALLVTVRDARITGVIVARRVVLVTTAAVTVAIVVVITVKYRRTLRQARSQQPKKTADWMVKS
jgi:hypothetical protein